MFCLSYVMVMGSEHGVALDHLVGNSELSSFGRVPHVVDPIPKLPPVIPKPVEHEAIPDHEVVPEDTGLSSLQSLSKKDERETSIEKGFSAKMRMLRDQQEASLKIKQAHLDTLTAQRDELKKPVLVGEAKGAEEKARALKEKLSKKIDQVKHLGDMDRNIAWHEQDIVTTRAEHQKKQESIVRTHLNHDLEMLRGVDEVHHNLGITGTPITEQEVLDAYQKQSRIVTQAWDDLKQVIEDPAYESFLSKVSRAAVDRPVLELGGNPKVGMQKGTKIGGDFNELYGKEVNYVMDLRLGLAASRDRMLADIRNKTAKQQQISDTLSRTNPYEALGGKFRMSRSSEPSMTFDWFKSDVEGAHAEQVARLKTGAHVLGEDKSQLTAAVAHVTKAKDTVLALHKRLKEARLPQGFGADNWARLGLPKETLSLDEINQTYEAKKKQLEDIKDDADKASLPQDSGLHTEVAKELQVLQKAHRALVQKAQERIESMKKTMSSSDTVKNDKQLLGLDKVTSTDGVEQAYERAVQVVRGAGDEFGATENAMLTRLQRARDHLVERLSNPYQPRQSSKAGIEDMYDNLGLDEPTYSIAAVQEAADQRLQELQDHREITEDGGWVGKPQAERDLYGQNMRNLNTQIRNVQRSRDILLAKMKQRIKTIQSNAGQSGDAADRHMLGDIGIPPTEQTIDAAYERTLKEINGAESIIKEDELGQLKSRAQQARDQLIESLAPPTEEVDPKETEEQRRETLQARIPDRIASVLGEDDEKTLIDFAIAHQPSGKVKKSPQEAGRFARGVAEDVSKSSTMMNMMRQPGVVQGFADEWDNNSLSPGVEKSIGAVVDEEEKTLREKVEIGVGAGIWVAAISGLIAWIIEENTQ